jgi:type VI secretion system secreted protein VgrG
MTSRAKQAIETVLEVEGGFVNDPDDRGGATKWGITLGFYQSRVNAAATIDTIRGLTRQEAKQIYFDHIWHPKKAVEGIGYGDLPSGVGELVFSYAVNMGEHTAHRLLQRAVVYLGHEISVDGWLGPSTVNAAKQCSSSALSARTTVQALMYYYAIVQNRPTQEKFLEGWFYRACHQLMKTTEAIRNDDSTTSGKRRENH